MTKRTLFHFSQLDTEQAEKALTTSEHSKLSAQAAELAADYLKAWGNALFQFELKKPGSRVARLLQAERLRIIRLLRDNVWYEELL